MTDLNASRTVRMEDRGEINPDILSWNAARKLPVEVEATPMPAPFEVETLEGTMRGDEGDVLIRGVEGELYPCDADVFAATYELLEEPPAMTDGPPINPDDIDDDHPYLVVADCPARGCDWTHRVVWPPDNPDEVECLCRECRQEVVIPRDPDTVEQSTLRGLLDRILGGD